MRIHCSRKRLLSGREHYDQERLVMSKHWDTAQLPAKQPEWAWVQAYGRSTRRRGRGTFST